MIKTPRYVIDLNKFYENCLDIITPFQKEWGDHIGFGYSVKTNHDAGLIRFANTDLNWNIEVVSPDEYHYVKSLGINDDQIILNGPAKISMFRKLEELPGIINLDNKDEVQEFCDIFPDYKGLVGLRLNLNLEERCPGETTAGEEVSRFGIDVESQDLEDCFDLLSEHHIDHIGLHLHTSTKTRSLKVFSELAKLAVRLKQQFHINFSFIDMGGGFFGGQKVKGKPSMPEYAKAICDELKAAFDPSETLLILEPGASVLATCVTYHTRIVNRRIIRGVPVLTVDGTLLHINPFMSKRNQPFDVLSENYQNRKSVAKQIIGGATCMENDRLGNLIDAKELLADDILSFKFAGAYTMGLNSHFILNPPEVEYLERSES